jgi:aminoglycoside phosphotransferase (APT) family kinase protein
VALLTGVDVGALEAWLPANVPGAEPPLRVRQIPGGRSNLTYRVETANGRALALRRPPLGPRLASAHDMSREQRVLSALGRTPVPVPPVLATCSDESVVGAPFYVMEFVQGEVLRRPADASAFDPSTRRAIGEGVVDTLVALHSVEPAAVGLDGLGRPDGYLDRQLRRWKAQWQASKTRELPLIDELHRRLSRAVPPQHETRVVHGDYRLDNVIVSPEGTVAAVLDWELCTLGDPLADLGLLLVYWVERGDEVVALSESATTAEGFPSRAEVTELYALRSGRDVADIDYYVALGTWKLAIILEGVLARQLAGAYGDRPDGVEPLATVVSALAQAADEAERRRAMARPRATPR